jgi:serine/threonine-protein kinase
VHQRSFPKGQAAASKLKALHLHLEASGGRGAEFLAELHLHPSDIEDETHLLPLSTLHEGLKLAVKKAGPDAIRAAAERLVARENLGVWMRPLRAARSPEELLSRIDGSESDYGRTTRWETLSSEPGAWSGRVHIAHDPLLEEDGLLKEARAAELSVVPTLFGYARAEVEIVEPAGSEAQEFKVRWRLPRQGRATLALYALAGGVPGVVVILSGVYPPLVSALVSAACVVVGAAFGHQRSVSEERGVLARAKDVRVRALERSLELKEAIEGGTAGDLSGSVVAGLYRLGKRMGSGASGVIYEAVRIGDGTPVAIKLLRAAAAHDTVASDRLRREAEALGLAWHPNVVEVLDHGHLADGTSYLVMELLRGDPLATYIKDRVRLSPDEVLPIAIEICEALSAIHAAGVVHRDIKPSNVMLVPHPDAPDKLRAKVLDFGIAKVEWEAGDPLDARSDLYAFGALLYECFMGEPPPIAAASLWRVEEPPLVLGAQADSGVHRAQTPVLPEWRELIERALEPDKEDRYPDARAFLVALRALSPARVEEPASGVPSERSK